VTLETGKGTITIDGKTSTVDGDIRVKAASEKYDPNGNNIVFGQDGKLESGKDAYLIAKNGDLVVSDDVTAKGTFYAQTEVEGNITLGKALTVQNSLSMKTDKGDITIGHTVEAVQGDVAMQVADGKINIGKNIKAGQNVNATVNSGDITVGADVEAVKDVNLL